MDYQVAMTELISGIGIVISVLLLLHIAFLGKDLERDLNWKEGITIGVIFGLTCLLCGGLKITTIFIVEIMIASLLILIAFFVGGMFSGITTGIMYGIFIMGSQSFLTELGMTMYIYLAMVLIGCSCEIKFRENSTKKLSWFNLLKIIVLLLGCALLIVRRYTDIVHTFVIFVPLGGALYYLVSYLETVNQVYKQHIVQAHHDFLTGLGNVRTLDNKLGCLVDEAKKSNHQLSTLMLDLDHFKKINDTHGHEAGDIVLQELASILRSCCRATDVIIRKGGEEFCILLPNCDSDTAYKIAERIRKEVKFHQFELSSGKRISVTISIGVSTLTAAIESPHDLINCADEALYEAKNNGRNRVVLYHC